MALQLEIEAVAEQSDERVGSRSREVALSGDNRGIERAAGAARKHDQAIGLAFEPGELEVRRLVRRRLQERAGIEPHQTAVAVFSRRQENNARALDGDAAAGARSCVLVAEIDRQCAADDRLN